MRRYTLAEIRAAVHSADLPADHRLYVIRDHRGVAVYVGRSAAPWTRARSHALGATWQNPSGAAVAIGAAGDDANAWTVDFWTAREVVERLNGRSNVEAREFVAAAELALIGLERPTLNGERWWADDCGMTDELAFRLMEGVPE